MRFVDPKGLATNQQLQEVITEALNVLQNTGSTTAKGPATNKGSHFADVVSFDPEAKELHFFDNKVQSSKKTVSKVGAFDDKRKAGVIKDAYDKFK